MGSEMCIRDSFHGWHRFEQDGSMLHQFVYPSTGEALEHAFGPGADPTPWLDMDPIKRRRRGLEIYEFVADPVGLHLYHCHSLPLKRHIHKGLYGAVIIDRFRDGLFDRWMDVESGRWSPSVPQRSIGSRRYHGYQ